MKDLTPPGHRDPTRPPATAEAVMEEIRQIALVFDHDFDLYGSAH